MNTNSFPELDTKNQLFYLKKLAHLAQQNLVNAKEVFDSGAARSLILAIENYNKLVAEKNLEEEVKQVSFVSVKSKEELKEIYETIGKDKEAQELAEKEREQEITIPEEQARIDLMELF